MKADQIPESGDFGVRSSIWRGVWIILTCFIGVGAWMMLAPLHGAIVAPGNVKVESNRKTILHQEGGIVHKILVRDGELVRQGQPLVLLEDLRVDASVGILRDKLDAELIREARLHAESTLAAEISYPEEIQQRNLQPRITEFMDRESALFKSRLDALNSQITLLKRQIIEVGQEAAGLQQQIDSERQSLAYAGEELQINQSLFDRKFIGKARILELKRAESDYRVRLGEHIADLARSRQLRSDLELRIASLRNDYVKNAADELKNSSSEIASLREQLRPSEDAVTRQTIVSPVDGKVVGIKVFTEGAAIGPREPMMDIVPENSPLLVETRVNLDAISNLRIGQPADIRFTTYSQRTTPLIPGKVIYISADSLQEKDGTPPYYLVRIAPDLKETARHGISLQAGMGTEVYIQTRQRSVMDYLLEPVTDSLRHAMREK